MNPIEDSVPDRKATRKGLVMRFILLGASVGLVAGLYEAGLLFFKARSRTLLQTDVSYAIWFLAPLVGLLFFTALHAALGTAAAAGRSTGSWRTSILAAIGFGVTASYLAWAADVLQIWIGKGFTPLHLWMPLAWFAGVFAYSLATLRVAQRASADSW